MPFTSNQLFTTEQIVIQNYTQAVSGSVASVGVLSGGSSVLKAVSGSAAAVGVVVKSVGHKVPVAAVAAVGTIRKSVGKVLLGTDLLMSAAAGCVATLTAGIAVGRNLSASVGVVIPSPLSPLLPFYTPRIILQVGKKVTATAVAAVPSLRKSVGKRFSASVAGTATIVNTVGKRLLASIAAVGTVSRSVPATQVLMSVVVAVVGAGPWGSSWNSTDPVMLKRVNKPLSASIASAGSIVGTLLAGIATFPAHLTATVLAKADNILQSVPWGDSLWGTDPWGGSLTSGIIKRVFKSFSTTIPSTLTLGKGFAKPITADPVALVATVSNRTGKILTAGVVATGSVLNHIIRAASLVATVAVAALSPIASHAGGLTTQALTASVAAVGVVRKQVLKPLTVVLAAPTLTMTKQVQLHLLPVVALVASFTMRTSKRLVTAVVHLVAPGPIGRFGLHFLQTLSTTVPVRAFMHACLALRLFVHLPGSIPVTPEIPDDELVPTPRNPC